MNNISVISCSSRTTPLNISFQEVFTQIGEYNVTKTITPVELTFDEAKTIVASSASVISKIQLMQGKYTVDPTDCAICYDQTNCPEVENVIQQAIEEL